MISIHQSGKADYDRAFMALDEVVGGSDTVGSAHAVVTPGEVITTEAGFLRGHGTHLDGARLVATVSGVVERVNKLISVRPLKTRYMGEIGDVIIGRVCDVGERRWKVDINACQHAVLMLSSVNLHGGMLRRRTQEDQLQMRQYYDSNDLVSAEVQQFYQDGCMSIHTRSLKFGKLENGQLATASPTLIKRLKHHFVKLPCGVDIILGCNGYIWVQEAERLTEDETREEMLGQGGGARNTEAMQSRQKRHADRETDFDARERIARVGNAIRVLADAFVTISPDTIMDIYDASLDLPAHAINDPAHFERLIRPAVDRIAEGRT